MSTRISRGLAGALLGLLLTACAATLVASGAATVRVAGQDVTVVAPPGLCIDPRSLDVTRAGAFLLISDCAVLSDAADPNGRRLDAVISASVSTGGIPGSLDDLEEFLNGPGILTIGRSGEFDKVRILDSFQRNGALLMKVEDRGQIPIPGAAATFWRGFFQVSNRLIGVTVLGFAEAPLSDRESQQLIFEMIEATRRANGLAPPEG